MKIISRRRIYASLLLLSLSSAIASAQQPMMVNFVRPGESNPQGAYLSDCVDVSPQFPGGEAELIRFLNQHRNYPRDAYELGIQGRVVCGFIVDVDGTILNASVHRGPCRSLGAEAIRLVESMPRWEPGRIHGQKVPCYYLLAIPFRL